MPGKNIFWFVSQGFMSLGSSFCFETAILALIVKSPLRRAVISFRKFVISELSLILVSSSMSLEMLIIYLFFEFHHLIVQLLDRRKNIVDVCVEVFFFFVNFMRIFLKFKRRYIIS